MFKPKFITFVPRVVRVSIWKRSSSGEVRHVDDVRHHLSHLGHDLEARAASLEDGGLLAGFRAASWVQSLF